MLSDNLNKCHISVDCTLYLVNMGNTNVMTLWYVVLIGAINQKTVSLLYYTCVCICEWILMSIYVAIQPITTDCRAFWPRRPSSTVYKTEDTAV